MPKTQTTKRSTRSTAAPSGGAAGDRTTPKPATAAGNLSPLQCLIADLVGDILVRGGHRTIVESLVLAAKQQATYRKYQKCYGDEPEKLSKEVLSVELPDEWISELKDEWRRNRTSAPQTTAASPATASARIRATVLQQLRNEFERFMADCNPEECAVMVNILQTHQSSNKGCAQLDQMPLGMAIEWVMGEYKGEWVRVPDSMLKQVEAYVGCLRAAEKCRH